MIAPSIPSCASLSDATQRRRLRYIAAVPRLKRILTLLLPPLAPIAFGAWVMRSHAVPTSTWGQNLLAAGAGTAICAGLMGAFPIPLMGYGVSPILGYYLALGAAAFPGESNA